MPNYGVSGRTCYKDFGIYSRYNGKLSEDFQVVAVEKGGGGEERK